MAVPTFLQNNAITIVRTHNGYALAAAPADPAAQSVCFETWAALTYYLGLHFVRPITP
ncbi:MAG TPA: hypothetical protein VEY92_08450 [Pseudoxanthomonas sp.]|nr:hypothetical protein [Pseudoxanthomonas sp.]